MKTPLIAGCVVTPEIRGFSFTVKSPEKPCISRLKRQFQSLSYPLIINGRKARAVPSTLERPGRPQFLARRMPPEARNAPGLCPRSEEHKDRSRGRGKKGRPLLAAFFVADGPSPPTPPEGGQIPRRSLRSTGAEQKSLFSAHSHPARFRPGLLETLHDAFFKFGLFSGRIP